LFGRVVPGNLHQSRGYNSPDFFEMPFTMYLSIMKGYTTLPAVASTEDLSEKILRAGSDQEVTKICENITAALLQEDKDRDVTYNFIERVIVILEGYNPRNKNLRQWSNIYVANNYFHRFRESLKIKG